MLSLSNRRKLAEIDVNKATRCPLNGMMALDGWTWSCGDSQDKTACAVMCSKWKSGNCNECGSGLRQLTETM